MLNIFITSTERRCGKTFIAAGLGATMQSLGYSTNVYKPVQTGGIEKQGFTQSQDFTFIKTIDPYINTNFSYLFKAKEEPLIAAELENEILDIDFIQHEYQKNISNSECTIIDGEGGILSPIAANVLTADMIKKIQIPVIIVTTPSVNTINNTLMTIYTALEKQIQVRGVIINNITENCSKTLLTNISRVIEEYSDVKILGLVPNISNKYRPEDLITACLNGIDIESVFNVKIEKLDIN